MHPEYSALAEFTLRTWWWPCLLTLATVWFWRQTVRQKKTGAEGVKALLVLNNITAGVLIFRGILPSGWGAWLQPGLPWANMVANAMVLVFFLTALLWLLDLTLGRTPLTLPRNPILASAVILACTLGLIFPVLEWLGGHHLPHAQAFGAGSVPLLVFSAALLGGARPTNWLGKLLLWMVLVGSTDAAAAALAGKNWLYLLAPLVALGALVYVSLRPRFVELTAKQDKAG
jgi:hypothetical protein